MKCLPSLALIFSPAATPVTAADDNNDAAAAVLLLLGAAAMAHHEDHHYDGAHSNDAKYEEHFERGFNDGLYGESFDQSRHGQAHAEGYSAGTKERSNRLAHKNRGADHENAPDLAKRACVGEASARWGRNPRDIVVIKSKKAARDDFYVEVSAGHRHGLCEVSHDGNIYNFEKGTL